MLLPRLMGTRRSAPPESPESLQRRDTLTDAAVALAEARGDAARDIVLHIAAAAAARIAGAAAVVVTADDGRLERLVGPSLDGCTRETLSRPEILSAVEASLDAVGRPLGVRDLDVVTARTLAAVAPDGCVFVRIEPRTVFVLIDHALDDEAVRLVTVLARLTAAALRNGRTTAGLRATCNELHELSAHVLVRQDDELGRTADELHEGTCQRLAAANAQLEALAAMLEGQRAPLARLRDARALVNQALGELRELAQRMRPSVLASLGYVEALRWYLKRLRDRAGVALSLEVEGAETRLPSEIETALYRATEDALGAAAEARMPSRLRVRYRREPEAVRIEIDGPSPDAIDLVAIRERLRPFGGAVHVTASDEHAVIRVEVPAP